MESKNASELKMIDKPPFWIYFLLRVQESTVGQYVFGMLMLPFLLIGLVLLCIASPFAWTWDVYDEWKYGEDENS